MLKIFTLPFLMFSLLIFQNAYAQENRNSPQFAQIVSSQGFSMPIDCKINQTCWIMNYVDYAPDNGKATDMACLNRTYDTHKGTDFALLDEDTMQKGVAVLAPKEGTITKIRDGQVDQWPTKKQMDAIKEQRKECGNAILMDHGNDIQTIYCHLKKGSITVKPNQKVKAGEKIAEVGLSGLTEFPHLHFGIIKNKKVIDPFTGLDNTQKCNSAKRSLWHKDINLSYEPFSIQSLGFTQNIPTLEAIEKNSSSPQNLSFEKDAIILWVVLLGMRKDDVIDITIKDPNNKILLTENIIQDKNRIRQFYYIGKKIKSKNLPEGAYIGEVKVTRPDTNKQKSKLKAILINK